MKRSSVRQLLLVILALALVQGLFEFFQSLDASKTTDVVRAVLKNETALMNPQRLTQNLLDLQTLRLIACLKVARQRDESPFLDESRQAGCSKASWWLDGATVNQSLATIDGQDWRVSFRTVNPTLFYVALWLSRLILVLTITFIFHWIKMRDFIKDQAILAERTKANLADELAAQVAHDIRSPLSALNILITGSNIVEKRFEKMIADATQRINDIATELLERGQRQRAKATSDLPKISIGEVVQLLVSEKRLQYSRRADLEIKLEAAQDVGSILGLKSELERVLSNLINNAIEALPESGGTVTVYVRRYDSEIHIGIVDTGCGMPAEILAKLGERGFSFGQKATGSGSGLGIYHAKSTMTKMGGQLKISSREGQGTMVTLIFPV